MREAGWFWQQTRQNTDSQQYEGKLVKREPRTGIRYTSFTVVELAVAATTAPLLPAAPLLERASHFFTNVESEIHDLVIVNAQRGGWQRADGDVQMCSCT